MKSVWCFILIQSLFSLAMAQSLDGLQLNDSGTPKGQVSYDLFDELLSLDATPVGAEMKFSTGGVERVRIDDQGRVGVGTSSPEAQLDVSGGVKLGAHTDCTANTEGTLRYNSSEQIMEFCNGTDWMSLGGGTQSVPVILSAGERSGAIDLTETITIDEDGILMLTGYTRGGNYPFVSLSINSDVCARDRSYNTGTNHYTSASCSRELAAGSHTIRSLYNETSGTANFVENRMSWFVVSKNANIQIGGGGSGDGTPAGAVMAFDLSTCPDGWTEYVPARGRFVRGIDSTGANDPDGVRAPGSTQLDQMQRITGLVTSNEARANNWFDAGSDTALTAEGPVGGVTTSTAGTPFGATGQRNIQFDSSNSPDARVSDTTDGETRPVNVALLYCRKD